MAMMWTARTVMGTCALSVRGKAILSHVPFWSSSQGHIAFGYRALATSSVYTRTGDKGTSSLYNGERQEKDHPIFVALGDTDELNAHIGMAEALCQNQTIKPQLHHIQSRLLDIGSLVATPLQSSNSSKIQRVAFSESHIDELEKWIDAFDAKLPALKNFILPSGGVASAQLHIARTVCRRSERRLVGLTKDGDVPPVARKYLNRLSDYLFMAARIEALDAGNTETVYKKGA